MTYQTYLPAGARPLAMVTDPRWGIVLGIVPGGVFLSCVLNMEETFTTAPAFRSLHIKEHHGAGLALLFWMVPLLMYLLFTFPPDHGYAQEFFPGSNSLLINLFLVLAAARTVWGLYTWRLVVFTASVGKETVTIRTRDNWAKVGLREFIRATLDQGTKST